MIHQSPSQFKHLLEIYVKEIRLFSCYLSTDHQEEKEKYTKKKKKRENLIIMIIIFLSKTYVLKRFEKFCRYDLFSNFVRR